MTKQQRVLEMHLLRGTWVAIALFMTSIIFFGRQITVAGIQSDLLYDSFACLVVALGVAAILWPCCDRLVQWWYRLAAFVLLVRASGLFFLLVADQYDDPNRIVLQMASYLVSLVVFMNSYLQWKLVAERAC